MVRRRMLLRGVRFFGVAQRVVRALVVRRGRVVVVRAGLRVTPVLPLQMEGLAFRMLRSEAL